MNKKDLTLTLRGIPMTTPRSCDHNSLSQGRGVGKVISSWFRGWVNSSWSGGWGKEYWSTVYGLVGSGPRWPDPPPPSPSTESHIGVKIFRTWSVKKIVCNFTRLQFHFLGLFSVRCFYHNTKLIDFKVCCFAALVKQVLLRVLI